MIGKIDEALLAVKQGLAQRRLLADNLLIQYELAPRALSAAKVDSKKTISLVLTELPKPIIFLAIEGLAVNISLLRRKKKSAFRQGRLRGERKEKYPIRVLLETAVKRIGAKVYERREDRACRVGNPLK